MRRSSRVSWWFPQSTYLGRPGPTAKISRTQCAHLLALPSAPPPRPAPGRPHRGAVRSERRAFQPTAVLRSRPSPGPAPADATPSAGPAVRRAPGRRGRAGRDRRPERRRRRTPSPSRATGSRPVAAVPASPRRRRRARPAPQRGDLRSPDRAVVQYFQAPGPGVPPGASRSPAASNAACWSPTSTPGRPIAGRSGSTARPRRVLTSRPARADSATGCRTTRQTAPTSASSASSTRAAARTPSATPTEEPKVRAGLWTQRFQAAVFEHHPENAGPGLSAAGSRSGATPSSSSCSATSTSPNTTSGLRRAAPNLRLRPA